MSAFNPMTNVLLIFRWKPLQRLTLVTVILASSACVVQAPERPDDPAYAPVLTPSSAVPAANDGAIYRPQYGLSLFEDSKARRVGDIITVQLSERTVSTKSTAVSMTKESDVSIPEPNVLGTTPSFKNLSLDTSISQDREFTGEADADQSNRLDGNITVTVAQVLPNGNMVVRGEKWITLNRGDEYIRVSGIVRPDDISPDNSVMSTKLANARIEYSGTGELADNTQAGWLTRFFNSPVWPF